MAEMMSNVLHMSSVHYHTALLSNCAKFNIT